MHDAEGEVQMIYREVMLYNKQHVRGESKFFAYFLCLQQYNVHHRPYLDMRYAEREREVQMINREVMLYNKQNVRTESEFIVYIYVCTERETVR